MIFGIDVAHFQAGIDFGQVRREGFEFVLCKVTQDVGFRDSAWPTFRDAARTAGLLVAGYHYVGTSSPVGQAANCRSWIGDPDIPVALDFELGSGTVANLRDVYAAFRAAGLRVALTYAPRWYWQQVGGQSMSGLPPLWSSRYPSTVTAPASELYRNVTGAHWSGYGGLPVAVLQFASTALVAGRQVDADAFLGTRDELAALLGIAPPPAPAPAAPSTERPEPSFRENTVTPVEIFYFDDSGHPDPDGLNFRGVMAAEDAATSAVLDAAWVRWAWKFGTVTGFKVVAWDASKPLGQGPATGDYWRLPSAVRSFTVEGRRENPGTVVAVAMLTRPR